jgi:hypothetical protein
MLIMSLMSGAVIYLFLCWALNRRPAGQDGGEFTAGAAFFVSGCRFMLAAKWTAFLGEIVELQTLHAPSNVESLTFSLDGIEVFHLFVSGFATAITGGLAMYDGYDRLRTREEDEA